MNVSSLASQKGIHAQAVLGLRKRVPRFKRIACGKAASDVLDFFEPGWRTATALPLERRQSRPGLVLTGSPAPKVEALGCPAAAREPAIKERHFEREDTFSKSLRYATRLGSCTAFWQL